MAKTFDALMKAEKENKMKPGETSTFDSASPHRPYMPSGFNLPTQVEEEYHRMKHSIISSGPEMKIKTILFSAPSEGEGNSTVLINFAITLALEGEKVLLVDANLRSPVLHDIFSLDKKVGLTELLAGENILGDVTKKTTLDNLSVITSGIPNSNPSTLLTSLSLDSSLEQMKVRADWVLFDSPPINSYNDSSALAAKMDGVVIVVQAEKTRWEVAQSAKDKLTGYGRINILGAVLNKRRLYIPVWIYNLL